MAQAKTYRVVGALPIHGNKPGAEFTAVLPSEQEAFLLAVGHLVIVSKKAVDDKPEAGKTGADKKENA